MKKIRKRLWGLLLTCAMVLLPVSQALAAVSYDASAGADSQALFPGDSLINLSLPVFMDGEEVTLETPGSWTNTDENRAFTADTSDDGASIVLSPAGYVLEVAHGESDRNDGSSDRSNHYIFPEDEGNESSSDIAFYQSGETVKIKADEPEEGKEFAGWTADAEELAFADPASAETTIVMPEKKVTVTANYQDAAPEQPQDTAEEGGGQNPGGGMNPDGGQNTGGDTNPNEGSDETASYTVTVNNGTGSDKYAVGTWVTVEANDRSAEGYTFTGWFVDTYNATLENPSSAQTGFTMPEADVTLSAQYEQTKENGGDGGQNPGGDTNPDDGQNTGGDTNPDDGQNKGGDTNLNEGSDETASYTVTVNDGTGSDKYAVGTWVTVKANDRSAEGYTFTGWFVDTLNATLENPSSAQTGFIMPAADVMLSAQYQKTENSGDGGSDNTNSNNSNDIIIGADNGEFAEGDGTQNPDGGAGTGGVQPQANDYKLTIAGGTVTSGGTEDLNAPGTYTVAEGESVTIKANAPEAGKVFSGWSGQAGNSASISFTDAAASETTFTMPASDVTITATFADATYTVSVENGTLDGQAASGTFTEGSTVTVTANAAAEGYVFSKWSGTATATGTPITFANQESTTTTFTVPAGGATVKAEYQAVTPTHRITVSNGTINGTATDLTVDEGTQITVSANPNPQGQAFAGWSITDASGVSVAATALGIDAYSSTITVTVNQSLNFLAQYEGIPYSLKVKKGTADYQTAVTGTKVTITADEAPDGKEFDYWEVQSGQISLANAYKETTTFVMPSSNVTVKAHYAVTEYLVEVENGSSDQDFYKMDESVTVSSNYPASGKEFDKWVAVSGSVSFADSSRWKTSFTMPGRDVAVKATYKDGPSADNNAILEIVSGGEYYIGDTIRFTASGAGMDNTNPNPGDYRYLPTGYQIGNVTGSWNASPYTTSMAIKAAGEYTLKVTYGKQVYNGSEWAADGTTDTKSVTFRVIQKAAGVATGDSTPLIVVAAVAGVSALLFIILLVVFIRRKRRQ